MLTLYITKKGRLIRADTYGPAASSTGAEWPTQGCSGRVVVEVGARMHPERLIGGTEAASAGAPEATLYVCSGARVQGGVFDLSCGSIWLGAGALVEPGVLVRGPAVIGEGTESGLWLNAKASWASDTGGSREPGDSCESVALYMIDLVCVALVLQQLFAALRKSLK